MSNGLKVETIIPQGTTVSLQMYGKGDVDALIAKKDKEIEELKCKKLDVKAAAHVLKAYRFYLCQLAHCACDEPTAQWIIDNWEQDYERVERYHA